MLLLPKVTKFKKSTQTKQMDNLSYLKKSKQMDNLSYLKKSKQTDNLSYLKMNKSNKFPILTLIYQ